MDDNHDPFGDIEDEPDDFTDYGAMTKTLASLIAEVPAKKRNPSFFDRLPPAQQKQLLDVRAKWQAGEFPSHVNAVEIHKTIAAAINLKVCSCTFRRWLSEKNDAIQNGRANSQVQAKRRKGKAPRKTR